MHTQGRISGGRLGSKYMDETNTFKPLELKYRVNECSKFTRNPDGIWINSQAFREEALNFKKHTIVQTLVRSPDWFESIGRNNEDVWYMVYSRGSR
jgi:hypothetical protein